MKTLYRTALAYAVLGLVSGLAYRELTKAAGFEGTTRLSLLHPHFLTLGMVLFLLVLVLERLFRLSAWKAWKPFLVTYNLGLLVTGGVLAARGVQDILKIVPSTALDQSLAGIAGIGHILLTAGIVLLFLLLGKSLGRDEAKDVGKDGA